MTTCHECGESEDETEYCPDCHRDLCPACYGDKAFEHCRGCQREAAEAYKKWADEQDRRYANGATNG